MQTTERFLPGHYVSPLGRAHYLDGSGHALCARWTCDEGAPRRATTEPRCEQCKVMLVLDREFLRRQAEYERRRAVKVEPPKERLGPSRQAAQRETIAAAWASGESVRDISVRLGISQRAVRWVVYSGWRHEKKRRAALRIKAAP